MTIHEPKIKKAMQICQSDFLYSKGLVQTRYFDDINDNKVKIQLLQRNELALKKNGRGNRWTQEEVGINPKVFFIKSWNKLFLNKRKAKSINNQFIFELTLGEIGADNRLGLDSDLFMYNFYTTFDWKARFLQYSSIKYELTFTNKTKKKYKKLKRLRIKLLSKLSENAFQPKKRIRPNQLNARLEKTRKQIWFRNKYRWYQNTHKKKIKRNKLGKRFLKSILGNYFISAQILTRELQYSHFFFPNDIFRMIPKYRMNITHHWRRRFNLYKRSWYNTNMRWPKHIPYFYKSSKKTYPYALFTKYWKLHKQNVWMSYLESKRLLYSGFLGPNRAENKWKQRFISLPYLRKRKPFWEKKNKLYKWRNQLVHNANNQLRVFRHKKSRLKTLVSKIILPFYGHLKQKQFKKIELKSHIKKPATVSRDTLKLNLLENRLDVLVYRLNLAPSILWARKLIIDGNIFLYSPKNTTLFNAMYALFKKNAYPLKLRDPNKLYNWQYGKRQSMIYYMDGEFDDGNMGAKWKFLLEPLKNIHYIVKPGEIILCAPSITRNSFKTNLALWKKPIPKNLLVFSNASETKNEFKKKHKKNHIKIKTNTKMTSTTVGIVLFKPKFKDLPKNDRIKQTFLRWVSM